MTASRTDWRIDPGDLTDPRIVDLLRFHVAAALAATPRGSAHALDVSALQRPEINFWAIWDAEALLGIGALLDLGGGQSEVKSMHTAQAARKRGVGGAMLRHIIASASGRGCRRLNLETGAMDYFAPARALYARHGFTVCPPFGSYKPDPNSVFMMLEL